MTVNLLNQLRNRSGLFTAGLMTLSSLNLAGWVHLPDDLLSGRSDRLRQRFAAKPDARTEAEHESQRLARSLALGWVDEETADPFLREDRRRQKRGDVEIASRRTSEGRETRSAERLAGAHEKSATPRKATTSSNSDPASAGRSVLIARPENTRRRNFDAELTSALAANVSVPDVELLMAPPGKTPAGANLKEEPRGSTLSPVKLNRPIPADDQSAKANRPASVPESRESGDPLLASQGHAGDRTTAAIEPFVVRIRPAAPPPIALPANAPRIARVNANQGPQDISMLTQSFHAQESQSVTSGASAQRSTARSSEPTGDEAPAAESASPMARPPLLGAPGLSIPPEVADTEHRATHAPDLRRSPVQLDAAVEPDEEPHPALSAMAGPQLPLHELSSDAEVETLPAHGPRLSIPPLSDRAADHTSADAARPPNPPDADVEPPIATGSGSVWIWLGGLCGVCGLSGLLAFLWLERRRFTQAAVLARRRATPRRWGVARAGSVENSSPRRRAA